MGRPRKDRLINQREIAREYGLTTRQVLRWSRTVAGFPGVVQVAGATRLFDRAAVRRYFEGGPVPSMPSSAPSASPILETSEPSLL